MSARPRLVSGATLVVILVGLAVIERSLVHRAAAQQTTQAPKFEVDPFWPKPLPNGWVMGMAIGVAVDSRDHIWIVHRGDTLPPLEAAADQNPPQRSHSRM